MSARALVPSLSGGKRRSLPLGLVADVGGKDEGARGCMEHTGASVFTRGSKERCHERLVAISSPHSLPCVQRIRPLTTHAPTSSGSHPPARQSRYRSR